MPAAADVLEEKGPSRLKPSSRSPVEAGVDVRVGQRAHVPDAVPAPRRAVADAGRPGVVVGVAGGDAADVRGRFARAGPATSAEWRRSTACRSPPLRVDVARAAPRPMPIAGSVMKIESAASCPCLRFSACRLRRRRLPPVARPGTTPREALQPHEAQTEHDGDPRRGTHRRRRNVKARPKIPASIHRTTDRAIRAHEPSISHQIRHRAVSAVRAADRAPRP